MKEYILTHIGYEYSNAKLEHIIRLEAMVIHTPPVTERHFHVLADMVLFCAYFENRL